MVFNLGRVGRVDAFGRLVDGGDNEGISTASSSGNVSVIFGFWSDGRTNKNGNNQLMRQCEKITKLLIYNSLVALQ